jgi:galactose mutarotase-like enzyme
MALYTLENEKLRVEIASLGGELQSIKDPDGCEYLWQGHPDYWLPKAIHMFPYFARLTQETYLLDGKKYKMGLHGFIQYMEMETIKKSPDFICFSTTENSHTLEQYPFSFVFSIAYRLEDNRIAMEYNILNKSEGTMYFGLGSHPGYNIPLEEGLAFEDYLLEFSQRHTPRHIGMTPACFVDGTSKDFPLEDGRVLRLRHELFDNDAIILDNVDKTVTLKSEKGSRGVTVSYPDMRYLALWHKPKTKAPYICIEPITSLPSRQDVIEDLSMQEDLISLPPGESYKNNMVITVF